MTGQSADYAVVGCSECDQLWVRKVWPSTAECPRCGARYMADRLKAFAKHDDPDAVREIRARMLADRADHLDAYEREDDYAELGERYERRQEQRRDLFAHSVDQMVRDYEDRYADAAGDFFDRWSTLYEDRLTDYLDRTSAHAGDGDHGDRRGPDDPDDLGAEDDADDPEDAEASAGPDLGTGSIEVRETAPVDSVAVEAAAAPSDTWQSLVENGLDEVLLDAVGSLQSLPPREIEDRLAAAAVDAFSVGGAGETTPTSLYRALALDAACGEQDAAWKLVSVAKQIGGGTSLGRSSLADVGDGPAALLQAAGVDATVSVVLDAEWRDRRRDQREDLLDLLVDLSGAVDVALVTGEVGRRFLAEYHPARLPDRVVDQCRTCHPQQVDDECLQQALGAFDWGRDGIDRAIVERVAESDSGVVTYDELYSLPVAASTIRDHVATGEDDLCGHGILRRTDRFGQAAVSTGPLFDRLRRALRRRDRRQHSLEDYREDYREDAGDGPDGAPADAPRAPDDPGVGDPPKSSQHGRDPARGREGGTGGPAAETATDTADGAADRPAPADPPSDPAQSRRERSYCHIPQFMHRRQHAAIAGAAVCGDIALVDREVEPHENPCEARLSWDWSRDEVAVAGQYVNPMQYMVSVAVALSREEFIDALSTDLPVEDLSLFRSDQDLLRNARCLGWLDPEAVDDAGDWLDALRVAREDLREMSGPAASDAVDVETLEDLADRVASDPLAGRLRDAADDDLDGEERMIRLRSIVTRYAHGLYGDVAHFLDLLGIDLLREVRIPDCSEHYLDDAAQAAIARMLSTTVSIQSAYGHYSVYRQLFEYRSEKRHSAWDPEVDYDDPAGDLLGSIVVVGPGVRHLQDEIRQQCDEGPTDTHPEAPQFVVPVTVDVVTDPDAEASAAGEWNRRSRKRATTTRAAARVLAAKNLRLTPEAGAILYGLLGDPYAVADALDRLEAATGKTQRLRLHEVRYALSTLDADRILPSASATVSAVVHALLEVDGSISQRRLADRADRSTQSIRNNRDVLLASRIVERTDDGWRLILPSRDPDDRGRHHGVKEGAVPVDLEVAAIAPPGFAVDDVPAGVVRLRRAMCETLPLATTEDPGVRIRGYALEDLSAYLDETNERRGPSNQYDPEDIEELLGPLCAHHYENWRPDLSPYGVLGGSQRSGTGGLGGSQRSGSSGAGAVDADQEAVDDPVDEDRRSGTTVAMGPPVEQVPLSTGAGAAD